MDCIGLIVSAGSYWLDCIGLILLVSVLGLLGENLFNALSGLILSEWDGWTRWDVGGTVVGWRD